VIKRHEYRFIILVSFPESEIIEIRCFSTPRATASKIHDDDTIRGRSFAHLDSVSPPRRSRSHR